MSIGRPLANRLLPWDEGDGEGSGNRHDDEDDGQHDAILTVQHSRTADLVAHTRRAEVLVTAAGVSEPVDGSMLSPGAVVVDVSANRRRTDDGVVVVGDVALEGASEVAGAVTPVPGGVGPVTLACLLETVVLAAERRVREHGVEER